MQSVNEIVKNPVVAISAPLLTVGTGWATLELWLPLITGTIATIIGSIGAIYIIYINWTQHKIKMKILRSQLAREGRRDRRDD